jgi:hypothetical protein
LISNKTGYQGIEKQKDWVSASEIGKAVFCPHYLELKKNGVEASKRAKIAMERGNIKHDILNETAEDTRCYIASHLYGVEDGRTKTLRDFRDKHLINTTTGKATIYIYYKISPIAVVLARNSILLDSVLASVVGYVLRYVKHSNDND